MVHQMFGLEHPTGAWNSLFQQSYILLVRDLPLITTDSCDNSGTLRRSFNAGGMHTFWPNGRQIWRYDPETYAELIYQQNHLWFQLMLLQLLEAFWNNTSQSNIEHPTEYMHFIFRPILITSPCYWHLRRALSFWLLSQINSWLSSWLPVRSRWWFLSDQVETPNHYTCQVMKWSVFKRRSRSEGRKFHQGEDESHAAVGKLKEQTWKCHPCAMSLFGVRSEHHGLVKPYPARSYVSGTVSSKLPWWTIHLVRSDLTE